MTKNPDHDFASFTQDDWIAYAWELLEYPPERLTLDDVMDESTDIEIEDLRDGRPTHTEDHRFDDVRDKPVESDPPGDPKSLLCEIYSLKEYIEESPHPEYTNVRRLGKQLQLMYTEYGIAPTGVNSGELIDSVVSR